MKIAVILTGHLRTWSSCKSSFRSVLAGHTVDYFVETYDCLYGYHPVNQMRFAYFDDVKVDDLYLAQLFEGLNLVNYTIHNFDELKSCQPEAYVLQEKFGWSGNVYFPLLLLKHAISNVADHSNKCKEQYDIIIKSRTDLILNRNYVLTRPKNREILIPSQKNVYPNDWLLIAQFKDMYFIADQLLKECLDPAEDSILDPPHGIFRNVFKRLSFTVTPVNVVYGILRYGNRVEWNKRWVYYQKYVRRYLQLSQSLLKRILST